MLIISACNEAYLRNAIALAWSIDKNTHYQSMISLLNCPKGSSKKFPKSCKVNETNIDFVSKEWEVDYIANCRVSIIDCCLQLRRVSDWKNILWLDADSIVRSESIAEIDAWLHNVPSVAVDTAAEFPGSEENSILISTVGVSGSREGRDFMSLWLGEFLDLKDAEGYNPSIMTCQIAYVRAARKWKGRPYKDLTYHFSDKHMKDSSPIWEAQGPTRKQSARWIAEVDKYYEMSKEVACER